MPIVGVKWERRDPSTKKGGVDGKAVVGSLSAMGVALVTCFGFEGSSALGEAVLSGVASASLSKSALNARAEYERWGGKRRNLRGETAKYVKEPSHDVQVSVLQIEMFCFCLFEQIVHVIMYVA